MGKILCRVIGGGSSVGTAKAQDVIKGKTFSNDDDVEINGTLEGTGTSIESDVLKGKSFYNTNLQNKLTGTLELTGDASEYDVIQNKGFYSKDPKIKKTGTLPDYPSGTDAQSCALTNNYLYYRINKGAYRATWIGDQTEVKCSAQSVIAALGISSITSFKVAQYGPNTLRFTWAKPSKGLWSGVHIIGKLNSWPTSPTDGTNSWDSGDTYKDSGTLSSGTWYFRAYSYITWTGGRYYSKTIEGSASIYNTTAHGNTTLTGSTKWTVPSGCNYITAFLVGGGGGLSWPWMDRSTKAISSGAAGGYTKTQGFSVTPGETLSITVGAGSTGNGGTSAIYHQNGSSIVSAGGGGAGSIRTWSSGSDKHSISGGAGGSGGGAGEANHPKSGGSDGSAYAGKGGSDGSAGGYSGYNNFNSDGNPYSRDSMAGGPGQGYSTKAWGNQGQPYSPGCGGGSLSAYNNSEGATNGKYGAGLTGNNSGAAANKIISKSRYDNDYAWNAGSASGSSGVVLLKW